MKSTRTPPTPKLCLFPIKYLPSPTAATFKQQQPAERKSKRGRRSWVGAGQFIIQSKENAGSCNFYFRELPVCPCCITKERQCICWIKHWGGGAFTAEYVPRMTTGTGSHWILGSLGRKGRMWFFKSCKRIMTIYRSILKSCQLERMDMCEPNSSNIKKTWQPKNLCSNRLC